MSGCIGGPFAISSSRSGISSVTQLSDVIQVEDSLQTSVSDDHINCNWIEIGVEIHIVYVYMW